MCGRAPHSPHYSYATWQAQQAKGARERSRQRQTVEATVEKVLSAVSGQKTSVRQAYTNAACSVSVPHTVDTVPPAVTGKLPKPLQSFEFPLPFALLSWH